MLEIPAVWLDLAMASQALVSCFDLGGPTINLHMTRAACLVKKALYESPSPPGR